MDGTTARVSVGASGAQANDLSESPSLSSDGRLVAFSSFASNLVPGDTNSSGDVFIRDRQGATTIRVGLGPSGAQGNEWSFNPSISGDGRQVAFVSLASNLVSGDTNGKADVFVYDRNARATVRVNVTTGGAQSEGEDLLDASRVVPSASTSGRFILFGSFPGDLAAGTSGFGPDVLLRDRDTDADGVLDEAGSVSTTLVSVAPGGGQANDNSYPGSISGDGRYAAFTSYAPNLAPDDTNNAGDVFLRDRTAGSTVRVSVGPGLQGNQNSSTKVVSFHVC